MTELISQESLAFKDEALHFKLIDLEIVTRGKSIMWLDHQFWQKMDNLNARIDTIFKDKET